MKKLTRILAVTAILSMIIAVPVMAKEVSFASENTDVLVTMLEQNNAKLDAGLAEFAKVQAGPNAQAIVAAQAAIVAKEKASVNKECAQNHIELLSGKVYNAKVVEKTRLDQLNWFKSLAPAYPDKLAIAQNEYNSAVAITQAAEANLALAKIKLAPYL